MIKNNFRVLLAVFIVLLSFLTPKIVEAANTFNDVPDWHWAYDWIERLYNAGLTSGCSQTPIMLYCPKDSVNRAQMAKFLLTAIHGEGFTPPPVGSSTGFPDVPVDHWSAPWIKQLVQEGLTDGCGGGNYCPFDAVNRAQMAKFLLTAKYGDWYTPPTVGEYAGFPDVPINHWSAPWIKQLGIEGITDGCGGGNYCPFEDVTRAQMAKFLVLTFNIPELEPNVYIKQNHTAFIDSIDYLHIVGEVRNNTNDNVKYVEVNVNVFNSNGQLLDTDFTYTLLNILPAGKEACFNLFLPEPEGWDYYEFEPVSYSISSDPIPNLSISNLSGDYDPFFGWFEVLGQVTNNHGSIVKWVSPVGTLYNDSDQVIGCDFTYVNSTDLAVGQTSAFDLLFWGRDYFDASWYKIQVEGDIQ